MLLITPLLRIFLVFQQKSQEILRRPLYHLAIFYNQINFQLKLIFYKLVIFQHRAILHLFRMNLTFIQYHKIRLTFLLEKNSHNPKCLVQQFLLQIHNLGKIQVLILNRDWGWASRSLTSAWLSTTSSDPSKDYIKIDTY
jgi:hypothetical protein